MLQIHNEKQIAWTLFFLISACFFLSPLHAYEIEQNGIIYDVTLDGTQLNVVKDSRDVTFLIAPNDYASLKGSTHTLNRLSIINYDDMVETLDTKRGHAYSNIIQHIENLAQSMIYQSAASMAISIGSMIPISIIDTLVATDLSVKGVVVESSVAAATYGIVNTSHQQISKGIKEIQNILAQPVANVNDIKRIGQINDDIYKGFQLVTSNWDSLGKVWKDSADPSATTDALIGGTTSLTTTSTAYAVISVGMNAIRSVQGRVHLPVQALVNQVHAALIDAVKPLSEFSTYTQSLYSLESLAGRQQLAETEEKKVQEEISSLYEQIIVAQNVESEKHESVQSLISQIDTLKQEHQIFEDKYDTAKQDLAAAETLYFDAKEKMDAIAEELDDLQGNIELYERLIRNYERGIISLTPQKLANYQATIAQLIEDEDVLQKSLRGKGGLMKEEQKAQNLYASLVAQYEQEVADSASEIQNKADKKISDEQVLKQVQQEIPVIEASIAENQQTLSDLTPVIEELQAKVMEQQNMVKALENQTPQDETPQIDYESLGEYAMQLVTGSPIEISQNVDIFNQPMQLTFDYLFTDNTGWLEVLLGDELLMEINGFDIVTDTFHNAEFWFTSDFFGQSDQTLTFRFDDDKSGSELYLDNINMIGIINGDFAQGITGWTISGDGYANIIDEGSILQGNPNAAVPEPATMVLVGFGFIGLAGVSRKKLKT